tara:strand:- start:43 stop:354 length:312 start_codon:yes stop_codon:yes gene_type:complete
MDITQALLKLKPNAQWIVRGDTLEWLDTEQTEPTKAEIDAEIKRLQAEQDALAYQELRAREYPPVTDYLDGIAKADDLQVQKYIDDCLAVKLKYPKKAKAKKK